MNNNKVIKRQFDLKFKKKAVKTLKGIRESGKHGDIKVFCAMISVRATMVYRWEQQYDAGLLKKQNAVAFSSNPKAMVRG